MNRQADTAREFRMSSPKVQIKHVNPVRARKSVPLPLSGKRTTLRDLIDRFLERLDARRR